MHAEDDRTEFCEKLVYFSVSTQCHYFRGYGFLVTQEQPLTSDSTTEGWFVHKTISKILGRFGLAPPRHCHVLGTLA